MIDNFFLFFFIIDSASLFDIFISFIGFNDKITDSFSVSVSESMLKNFQ